MKNKNQNSISTKKQQFLETVQAMVPGNTFISEVANHISEEMLPPMPGVAAFEFAFLLDTLCKSWRLRHPVEPLRDLRCASTRKPRGHTFVFMRR
jgi:hypothetical protein